MLLYTYYLTSLKKLAGSHKLWLLFAFFLMLQACAGNINDTGDYSKKFKPVYDTVNSYFMVSKQPAKGLRYLDSAFKTINYPYINDRFRYYWFHCQFNKGTIHNLKKALAFADSMMMMTKKSITQNQYFNNYAEVNLAYGDIYFALQQYDDAYKCYYQGYYAGKNTLDKTILAGYTYHMGMIMFKQGNYTQAINYFKLSFNQGHSKQGFIAFYKRQELLDNIGESYKDKDNIDSANLYFKKALNYINLCNARFGNLPNVFDVARGVVYGNQGDMAIITHHYTEADELLKKSIAINLKPRNDNHDAEFTEIRLARLYLATGKLNDLFNMLQSLRLQLNKVKNSDAETNWYHLMSSYYLQKKDYIKGLYYLKTFTQLKDSTIKTAAAFRHVNIIQQQANFNKDELIENLKDNNKSQLIYIYLAVLFSVMAVIIIFLVFRNLKRSKQDIIAIKFLNNQISNQKVSLENTLEEVHHGSREKDRILRAVAHDLRNPLGGIASLSEVMVADVKTEDQVNMMNLIKETSVNSLELINEILEATHTTVSKFSKKWVDINGLLSNSVELLRFKAAEKDQQIVLNQLQTPTQLLINREKIWRVVSNLISNAIKFSHTGAIISVGINIKDDGVIISVKDDGIGIPHNLQQQVFNMFTDAKRPGTGGEKSFGLGLSICRQIVEHHMGKIWLQSDVKYGSTFYVYLPYDAQDQVLAAI